MTWGNVRVAGGPGAPQQNVTNGVSLSLLCFDGHRNKRVPLSHWDPSAGSPGFWGMKKTEDSLSLSSVTMLGCASVLVLTPLYHRKALLVGMAWGWWWCVQMKKEKAGRGCWSPGPGSHSPQQPKGLAPGGPTWPPIGHITYLPRRLQVLCLSTSFRGVFCRSQLKDFSFFFFLRK